MNQQNFGVAVIPAMAGFFFRNRAKVQEIQAEKPQQLPAIISSEANGVTGVAKYLLSVPLVTSVAKYMKKVEKQQMTGVEKYVLRQTIAERNTPPTTGVTKYLVKAAQQPAARKKSGVEKYIAKQELAAPSLAALTGVAKYQAEQDLLAKKKAIAVLIQKYKEADEAAAVLAREAAEAAYMSSAEIFVGQASTDDVEEPATTRVGRYVQEQVKLQKKRPQSTSVSRYIAQKIVLDSQKPVVSLSKVGKYLRDLDLAENKKPNLTGVAKYLSKQPGSVKVSKPKEKIIESGVARYLSGQASIEKSKLVLSGVAKYMEKQAQLDELNKTTLKLPHNVDREQPVVEVSLEGEFIPAGDFLESVPTGVSKYLERQTAVAGVTKEAVKVTGVSRYLERQVATLERVVVVEPTGVDRYLQNRKVA